MRSFSSGRPLIASTLIGFEMSRSLISVLQASRLRPLMRIASEPQMPCAQERRNVSEPSCSHLILCSASRTRSVGYTSTSKSCQRGSVSTSGSKRRIRKVTVNDGIGGVGVDAGGVERRGAHVSTSAPSAGSG